MEREGEISIGQKGVFLRGESGAGGFLEGWEGMEWNGFGIWDMYLRLGRFFSFFFLSSLTLL